MRRSSDFTRIHHGFQWTLYSSLFWLLRVGARPIRKKILSGLWFIHLVSAKYVFDSRSYAAVDSKGNGGGKYAILSMIPEDLNLN